MSHQNLESPKNLFSGALHVQNADFHDGNMTDLSEARYEVQISFRHDFAVTKPII